MDKVYTALRGLSYYEMIELCTQLRDTAQDQGMDVGDAYGWAKALSAVAEANNPEVRA